MKDENKYMRFDHAAANVEAVPFVDEKIYTIRDKEQLIAEALSSRDAEIRKVLEGLRNPHRHVDLCWCDHDARFEPHDAACLATQALYAKLQPGKEGNDTNAR